MAGRWIFGLAALALLLAPAVWAQEPRYREQPLSLERMESFKDIPFRVENFETIASGMTEEQVLSILGKPEDIKKEHRPHDRWTAHYLYPGGYVINFRNGLVVGKEKN